MPCQWQVACKQGSAHSTALPNPPHLLLGWRWVGLLLLVGRGRGVGSRGAAMRQRGLLLLLLLRRLLLLPGWGRVGAWRPWLPLLLPLLRRGRVGGSRAGLAGRRWVVACRAEGSTLATCLSGGAEPGELESDWQPGKEPHSPASHQAAVRPQRAPRRQAAAGSRAWLGPAGLAAVGRLAAPLPPPARPAGAARAPRAAGAAPAGRTGRRAAAEGRPGGLPCSHRESCQSGWRPACRGSQGRGAREAGRHGSAAEARGSGDAQQGGGKGRRLAASCVETQRHQHAA